MLSPSCYILNDKLIIQQPSLLPPNIPGIKYGIGAFETMLMIDHQIRFLDDHFQRLQAALSILDIQLPLLSPAWLKSFVNEHVKETDARRIRLNVLKGDAQINGVSAWIMIEHFSYQPPSTHIHIALNQSFRLYHHPFSAFKTNQYLPFIMAAQEARLQQVDDVLLLNQHNRVADASIANVFIRKGTTLITPPVSEACVAGVMRKFILRLPKLYAELPVQILESPIEMIDLNTADEIFLSNAMGIRSVLHWNHQELEDAAANLIRTYLMEREEELFV